MREEIEAFWHYTLGKYFSKTPSIVTLFMTNQCNARCPHCFYWRNLNKKKEELTLNEIEKLSRGLGNLELLLASGGEPFLRNDLAQIVRIFWKNNHLRIVSIITNGLIPEKTAYQVEKILRISPKLLVIIPMSLDGTEKMHDRIRGVKGAFDKVRQSYGLLVKLKEKYPNLRLRFNATVSNINYDNLFSLIDQMPTLFPNTPSIWNLSLSFIRGNPRDSRFRLPSIGQLDRLFSYKREKFRENRSWTTRLFEKFMIAAELKIVKQHQQFVPCEAGRLLAVVYEDGSIAPCEMLPTVGSLKKQGFKRIWNGNQAQTARIKIKAKRCYCTHECNLYPSLIAHPLSWYKLLGLTRKWQ